MSARDDQQLTCTDCRAGMQDYLDETMSRLDGTRFFLHIRECEGCHHQLEDMRALFGALAAMPDLAPPEDFDARILQSVPYDAYRAMEPIRRERVPVFLENESLPVWVRSGATRGFGLIVSAVAMAATLSGQLPEAGVSLVVVGLLPEGLVRVQQLARRIYAGAVRQSENS